MSIKNDMENITKSIFNIFRWGYSKCKITAKHDCCVVLLNGPSIKKDLDYLLKTSIFKITDIAVSNNFPSTDYYKQLEPNLLFYMDRSFWDNSFSNKDYHEYRDHCFKDVVKNTTWPLTIVAPSRMKKNNMQKPLENVKNISLEYYNLSWLKDGSFYITERLLARNFGTLAAFSVLTIQIQILINAGYRRLFLLGADHSWHETISMGSDNRLGYNTNYNFSHGAEKSIIPMIDYDDKQTKISDFFYTYYHVFKSYEILRKYADRHKVEVLNVSSKSYIDAFERINIDSLAGLLGVK